MFRSEYFFFLFDSNEAPAGVRGGLFGYWGVFSKSFGSLPMGFREGELKLPRMIKMRHQQGLGVVYLDILVFFPSVLGLCPRGFGRGVEKAGRVIKHPYVF